MAMTRNMISRCVVKLQDFYIEPKKTLCKNFEFQL